MEPSNEVEQRINQLDNAVKRANEIVVDLEQINTQLIALSTRSSTSSEAIEKVDADTKKQLDEITATCNATRSEAESFSAELGALKTKASEDSKSLASLVEKAQELESNVDKYSADIDALINEQQQTFSSLQHQIEGLLPGATSAGLASAFESRKNSISKSQSFWKWTFISSLVLCSLAGFFLLHEFLPVLGVKETALDWTQFVRGIVPRLVLLSPLFWLAGFSARQLSVRFRLEEDYAHKEALSRAFEGYKREMTSMNETAGAASNLAQVVISALGDAPVRLYDANIKTDSPLDKLKEVAISKPSDRK